MRRLFVGGTTRQVAAIVVIALLAAHCLSTLVWLSFDSEPERPPEFFRSVSQIGLVLRLLEALPQEYHAAILAAAARGGLAARAGDGVPPVLDAAGETGLQGIDEAIDEEPELRQRLIEVGREIRHDGQFENLAILTLQSVPRGRWLLFELTPNGRRLDSPPLWISPNEIASYVAIPLLVGLISFWTARRVTGPLVKLTAATEKLCVLDNTAPVAEEGALEVRQVAHAFNSMLGRLRCFVSDRSRILVAIGHDLRTPLIRLRLRAEMVDDADARGKMLSDIGAMELMITSALASIREETAQERIEHVDMAVLLHTICDGFAAAGADVHYEGPLHCATSCRPQALQRAMNNLIDRAAKLGPPVIVRLDLLASGVTITVEDNGPGIGDEQREAVFGPFFRGDVSRSDPQGVGGLGLSVVKTIIESHNGKIELSNRAPQGLHVHLYIPHAYRSGV